jgi:hypothetical protein
MEIERLPFGQSQADKCRDAWARYQLTSIFGWKTLEQAELYTKKVRQQLMAGGSMHLIGFDQTVNECDPLSAGVEKSGSI